VRDALGSALAGVVPQRPNVSFPAELARGERSRDASRQMPTHWFSQFPESRILRGSRTVETTGSNGHLRVRATRDEPVVVVLSLTTPRRASAHARLPLVLAQRPFAVACACRSHSSAALATPLASSPPARVRTSARATTARGRFARPSADLPPPPRLRPPASGARRAAPVAPSRREGAPRRAFARVSRATAPVDAATAAAPSPPLLRLRLLGRRARFAAARSRPRPRRAAPR
jgi:hypothetical protein